MRLRVITKPQEKELTDFIVETIDFVEREL